MLLFPNRRRQSCGSHEEEERRKKMTMVLTSFYKAISRTKFKNGLPPPNSPQMPEPSSSDNRTDPLHALLRSRAVMERLGRSATFADVKRIGFLTDPEPAGGLAVSAYTEAVLRAGRTSLGVRLSDWITRRTVSNSLMANMIFAANDQSSETTNGRLRLAIEQLHGQQLSDFENEDTDSLEEPDELVD